MRNKIISITIFFSIFLLNFQSLHANNPVRSTIKDTKNPAYYDNTTGNKLLTPQVTAYLESQGAIKNGVIDTAKLGEIQRDLGLVGANGQPDLKLGNQTINAIANLRTLPSSPGNIPSSLPDLNSASNTVADPASNATPSDFTEVYTTEEIPGAKCTCVADDNANDSGQGQGLTVPAAYTCKDPKTRKYKCEVGKGLTAFQNMFREITKWVVYVTMLLGVFAIVGAGVLWAWGSESEEYTKKAKGWVMNILIGLVILFTFRYILGFIAPWIFQ